LRDLDAASSRLAEDISLLRPQHAGRSGGFRLERFYRQDVALSNWSLSFVFFEGEYPFFDKAEAAWKAALTKAKATLQQ
jgi:hypothetical protein